VRGSCGFQISTRIQQFLLETLDRHQLETCIAIGDSKKLVGFIIVADYGLCIPDLCQFSNCLHKLARAFMSKTLPRMLYRPKTSMVSPSRALRRTFAGAVPVQQCPTSQYFTRV